MSPARGELVNDDSTESFGALVGKIMNSLGGAEGFVLVDVYPIFARVCDAFGADPAEVMKEAYPEKTD